LILKIEHVLQCAVDLVSPKMSAGCGLNELPSNTQAPARLANAAFEHISNAQLSADLLDVHRYTLVSEGGIPSDDEQWPEAGECRYDVFNNSVGKVLLLGIATHILERQHSDGGFVWEG
jgi:hypothetical protein